MLRLAGSPPGAIRKRFLWPALAGLVGLAWLALGVWGSSPYAAILGHHELAQLDLYNPGVAALFIAGWALMVVAMMLPTSLPLLALFRRLTAAREDSELLIAIGGLLHEYSRAA